MTKKASTAAVTPAATDPDTLGAMAPNDVTTPAEPMLIPVTTSIPAGQKSPALDHPEGWLGTRAVAVSPDGAEYAFLGNNGEVYQGLIAAVSPRALAFAYGFGAKQKADSDGAKDKDKTAETASAISGDAVQFSDWCAPRVSGPREETATPVSLQVKALLIAKLKTGGLGAAIKAKKIKLTGFSGGTDSLFTRYAAVVKEATGMEATPEQWAGFTTRTLAEATAAIAAIAEDPFA